MVDDKDDFVFEISAHVHECWRRLEELAEASQQPKQNEEDA
jgi:hypothetical protein